MNVSPQNNSNYKTNIHTSSHFLLEHYNTQLLLLFCSFSSPLKSHRVGLVVLENRADLFLEQFAQVSGLQRL